MRVQTLNKEVTESVFSANVRKVTLKTCIRGYLGGIGLNLHLCSCFVRAVTALTSLCICTDSSKPLLLT